jgi:L-ascorbate metabolism protein UlaG (beta-lactamase superfamily)
MRLAERMVKLKVRPGTVACAWLGQAGYLMKTSSGVTVMIDPYFSDEVEKHEGLKRLFPPPITTDEMQPDILLVSYGHLDHLDEPVIRALAGRSAHDPDRPSLVHSARRKVGMAGLQDALATTWRVGHQKCRQGGRHVCPTHVA